MPQWPSQALIFYIEQHEDELLTGKYRIRISESKLDKLTMTAIKVKTGTSQRLVVQHDLKDRFRRISPNELNECRQTAVAMYESYLQRRQNNPKVSRPCTRMQTRRIPRFVFSRRFKIHENHTTVTRWWLNFRDSLDSIQEGRKIHDRLFIPLGISPFHLNQLHRGEIKALKIVVDRSRKWWIVFAIRVNTPELSDMSQPVAVLGIDLGIEKAACTSLVTPTKVRETKYFVQKDKVSVIKKLDKMVANLQHKMMFLKHNRQSYDKVVFKLRSIRNKRERVAKEYDRVLITQLKRYIQELSEKYTLYVAIGRLKYIRKRAQRGNNLGRKFRGIIHSWAFVRLTESLKHQLVQLGWMVEGKDSRFRVVSEAWTSIICWKCGTKGRRPKQNYFVCPACQHRTNADRNGAINIARRLIMFTKSLHSVRGLGKWADSVQRGKNSRLKARGKYSVEKSLLSKKDAVSHSRESVAVHHVQMDLFSFGDNSEKDDNDPAMERTVETFTAVGSDIPTKKQEKEARSIGGISSQ
jgi:transposase